MRKMCLVLLVTAASQGCYPVVILTSNPRYVCAGGKVDVSWRVKGSGTIAVRPNPPGESVPDGEIDHRGSFSMHPIEPTSITVRATRFIWPPTASQDDIAIGGDRRSLVASLGDIHADPGCDQTHLWATVHTTGFGTQLTVASLQVRRPYEIDHAGHHATITPSAPSNAFIGLPVEGDWVLRTPLAPGEVCGTATLPSSLSIDVLTQCKAPR